MKYKFNELVEGDEGLLKGPFGSDLKKSLYVPKSEDTYKVYLQENILKQDNSVGTHYISKDYYDKAMYRYAVKENDFVVTCDGTLGEIFQLKNLTEKGIISSSLLRITLNPELIDYDFFYYFFKQKMKKALITSANNSVLKHLPGLGFIRDFEIDIPDLPTQKKIADVLSCIDDKIALNNKTNTELENMAKTIYDYWFTQFDFPDKNGHPYKTSGGQMVYNEILKREIPAGWEVRTIESISKRVKVGFVGPIDEYYCDNDSGYPIIRPAEMSEQGINYDELRHITKEFYDKNLKSQVHKGDILLSRCGKDGIPNIYESDKESQVLNAVIIEPNREIISEYFTFEAMRSQFIQDQISNGTSGSVQGVINTKIIAAVILPFDETVAKKYVDEVSPIHQKISKCREESRKLISIRDYLLPLLMNGQIEVM